MGLLAMQNVKSDSNNWTSNCNKMHIYKYNVLKLQDYATAATIILYVPPYEKHSYLSFVTVEISAVYEIFQSWRMPFFKLRDMHDIRDYLQFILATCC